MRKIIFLLIMGSMCWLSLYSFDISKISEFNETEHFIGQSNPLIVYNDRVYLLNTRSLQVYAERNDSYDLLLDLPLQGMLENIDHIEDIFYVSSSLYECIYRIDLSDLSNPVITDQLEFTNYAKYFYIYDNYIFTNNHIQPGLLEVDIYQNEPFELIRTIESPEENSVLRQLHENIFYGLKEGELNLYDVSNPDSIIHFSNQIIPSYYPFQMAHFVNDSTLVVKEGIQYNVSVYNVSDMQNWELLSQSEIVGYNYRVQDNYLYNNIGKGFFIYEILDSGDIQLIHNSQHDEYIANIDVLGDDYYFFEIFGGFSKNRVIDDQLYEICSKEESGNILASHIIGTELFIVTENNGICHWDISNPYNPVYITNYFDDFIFGSSHIFNNTITAYCFIQDIGKQVIVINVEDDMTLNIVFQQPYDIDHPMLYPAGNNIFFRGFHNRFQRVRLQDNQLVFESGVNIDNYVGSTSEEVYFMGNTAIILGSEQIAIVDDIWSENEMTFNTLFSNNIGYYDTAIFVEEFIFLGSDNGSDKFQILKRMNNDSYVLYNGYFSFGGEIAYDYDGKTLFITDAQWRDYEFCHIYDMRDLQHNHLFKLDTFGNWSNCADLDIVEIADQNYLLYTEDTSASLYRYEGLTFTEDDQLPEIEALAVYPNPFNPETSISLSISEPSNLELIIYNIRGQETKTIVDKYIDKGSYEFIWDGTNNNNTSVASGIYYITMKLDGKIVSNKKCLLLK